MANKGESAFGKASDRAKAKDPPNGRYCPWGVGPQGPCWVASLLYQRSNPAWRLVPPLPLVELKQKVIPTIDSDTGITIEETIARVRRA